MFFYIVRPDSFIHFTILKNKNQLDATYYFIVLIRGSTCFGHYYAHHQELATIMLITTLVVSFYKDRGGSVNVKLWFLVVYVRYEVLFAWLLLVTCSYSSVITMMHGPTNIKFYHTLLHAQSVFPWFSNFNSIKCKLQTKKFSMKFYFLQLLVTSCYLGSDIFLSTL